MFLHNHMPVYQTSIQTIYGLSTIIWCQFFSMKIQMKILTLQKIIFRHKKQLT